MTTMIRTEHLVSNKVGQFIGVQEIGSYYCEKRKIQNQNSSLEQLLR
jgi:hypothetical protein